MLDKLGGISIEPDALQWLLTPARFKQTLIEQIRNAKQAIYISALYLEDDEAGREILAELLQAKAANPYLDIKVIVDYHRARRGLIGQAQDGGNDKMYCDVMKKAAVQFNIYGVPVKSREFLGVLHLKGFIIDDTVIYSGASINNIYLNQEGRYRFDRYHLISSPELARSMRQLIDRVIINDDAVCCISKPLTVNQLPDKAGIRNLKHCLMTAEYEFFSTNEGLRVTPLLGLGRKKNKLNNVIKQMVKESKRQLFICTPYFNPPYVLVRAFAKHLRQGKKLDILVGDKTANDFYIPPEKPFSTIGALPYIYEQALRKFAKREQWAIEAGLLNIYLWKHDNNSYHLKGMVMDDRKYLLTGSNLNPRAWSLDLENGILVHDDTGIYKPNFDKEHQHLLKHSQRINHYREIETRQNYPIPVKKIMTRIRRLKADFLLKKIL